MAKYNIHLKITSLNRDVQTGQFSPPIRIGRKSDNDIVFKNNKDISRYHLQILEKNGKVFVKNYSKNGYLFNGKLENTENEIRIGDKLGFNNSSKEIEVIRLSIQNKGYESEKSSYRPSRIYRMVNTLQDTYKNKLKNQRYYFISVVILLIAGLLFSLYLFDRRTKSISQKYRDDRSKIINKFMEYFNNTVPPTNGLNKKERVPDRIPNREQVKTEIQSGGGEQEEWDENVFRNKINTVFQDNVVEILYDLRHSQLTQNGFIYNGHILSPTPEEVSSPQIIKVSVKFLTLERPYPIFSTQIEYPFMRYKTNQSGIVFNYLKGLEKYDNIGVQEHIYFIEYMQQNSRHTFQFYKGEVVISRKECLVCSVYGRHPRIGALAITNEYQIAGLITTYEKGNKVVVRTLEQIESMLRTEPM